MHSHISSLILCGDRLPGGFQSDLSAVSAPHWSATPDPLHHMHEAVLLSDSFSAHHLANQIV